MAIQNIIDDFVQNLAGFDYSLSVTDHVWNIFFLIPAGNGIICMLTSTDRPISLVILMR